MKTKFESIGDSHVRITGAPYLLDWTDEPAAFEVYAPAAGGYVRFANSGSQVCESLSLRGNTLHWDPKCGSFVDLIRAQHRVAMRQWRSECAGCEPG